MRKKFYFSFAGKLLPLFFYGLVFLVFMPLSKACAQRIAEGKVIDETGAPAAYVTVKVKDKSMGTQTDGLGRFKLNIPPGSTLVFSSVNYESFEIKDDGRKTYNVTLLLKTSALNDVVVVGYATQKKTDVTGAIDRVSITDMQKAPVRSFEEALAGRVAGVQVISSDGQPGSGINVTVRGYNSITQSNSPLYVIDGFPTENPNNNVLNPQDIQSMDVLKDASATAIYGARGANGVIIITTKRGKEGPPVINFSSSYGFQKVTKTMELLNPYEFVKYSNEFDPTSANLLYFQNGRTLDFYKTQEGEDWQGQVFRTAPIQNHNISVSGGSQKTKYSISGSVFKQDGIIIASDYTRYQGRTTLDQTINDKLKVGINVNYAYLLQTGLSPVQLTTAGSTNSLYSVWGARPVSGFDNNDLDLLFDPSTDVANDFKINPILNINNSVRNNRTNNITANGYLEYSIAKDLLLRVTGGINNNTQRNETFNNSNTIFGSLLTTIGRSNGVNGSLIYNENNGWLNENTLTWNKRINKDHTINILAGVTEQAGRTSSYGSAAIFIPNESLGIRGLDEGTPQQITATETNWTLASFLSRVNYSYKSKYLFTVSYRADGSSRFSDRNKWSYFPSGAISWRFSQESFLSGLRFLDDGKLRASFGLTGNNRVADFAYLSTITLPIASSYVVGNNYVRGSNVTSIGNPDLKWETTEQYNLGLDLAFLKNRITFTADVYRKKTKDLLLFALLPLSLGYDNAFKNIGSVQNDGLELTLNTVNIRNKKFSWNSNFNISFYKNKVLALAENQVTLNSVVRWDNNYTMPAYIAQVGQPLGLMYGFISDGVYQYSDFNRTTTGGYILKDNQPTNGNSRNLIQPGDIKFKDINGDKQVNAQDYSVIGRGLPLYAGGFNNNFNYGNFDLNVFLQWSYGNDILNVNRMVFEGNSLNRSNLNQFASYANRWSPTNQDSDIPRTRGIPPNTAYSSGYVEDGSYIRLKTVSLGYRLPSGFLKKNRIRDLRVSVSAQNLLTWTNYSGMDPEVNTYASALTPGFDYSAYPRARVLTLNVNLSF